MAWYAVHKRDMPWRGHPDPYAVWVSEVMLQQTQVETVTPYFRRFMTAFPSVRHLADADQQEVLKVWEGLGYYSRARNLHRAAGLVVGEWGGRVPDTLAGLGALPGVGPYTAAAIASICYGVSAPVVDGNVARVLARVLGIEEDSTRSRVRRGMADYLAAHIPTDAPGDFNQATMELGAMVCRPKRPACESCPLRLGCVARRTHRTDSLPVRPKRKRPPHYHVAACVIQRRGRVLIAKRRQDQMLGGLWEFPGGKQLVGEELPETARREIMEETGLAIAVDARLCTVRHAYSHFSITLHAFDCRPVSGRARPKSCEQLKWVTVGELRDYPFSAADLPIVALLEGKEGVEKRTLP